MEYVRQRYGISAVENEISFSAHAAVRAVTLLWNLLVELQFFSKNVCKLYKDPKKKKLFKEHYSNFNWFWNTTLKNNLRPQYNSSWEAFFLQQVG